MKRLAIAILLITTTAGDVFAACTRLNVPSTPKDTVKKLEECPLAENPNFAEAVNQKFCTPKAFSEAQIKWPDQKVFLSKICKMRDAGKDDHDLMLAKKQQSKTCPATLIDNYDPLNDDENFSHLDSIKTCLMKSHKEDDTFARHFFDLSKGMIAKLKQHKPETEDEDEKQLNLQLIEILQGLKKAAQDHVADVKKLSDEKAKKRSDNEDEHKKSLTLHKKSKLDKLSADLKRVKTGKEKQEKGSQAKDSHHDKGNQRKENSSTALVPYNENFAKTQQQRQKPSAKTQAPGGPAVDDVD